MPAAAIGNGKSTVFSKTGTGYKCRFPLTTATDECSTKVFIGDDGAVFVGNRVKAHPKPGCSTDTSTLTTGSSKVTVEGQPMGRVGDKYTNDNIITSGSPKVMVGG